MNNINQIDILVEKYQKYSWYDSVGLDKYGRFVVYVHEMTKEVMETVQHYLNGKQVLLAYSHAKPNQGKCRYITYYDFGKARMQTPVTNSPDSEEDPDIDYLISELDRLERLCGSNALQDIFYEVHDKKNAVTNVRNKFPEVEESLQNLYDTFGFDLIYENIDG